LWQELTATSFVERKSNTNGIAFAWSQSSILINNLSLCGRCSLEDWGVLILQNDDDSINRSMKMNYNGCTSLRLCFALIGFSTMILLTMLHDDTSDGEL
jgi:hypothetical protein